MTERRPHGPPEYGSKSPTTDCLFQRPDCFRASFGPEDNELLRCDTDCSGRMRIKLSGGVEDSNGTAVPACVACQAEGQCSATETAMQNFDQFTGGKSVRKNFF